MRVTIEWEELCVYRAVVTVDDDELAKWADGEPITAAVVKNFLESGEDDSEWFEQCDPVRSLQAVEDRTLTAVTL